MNNKSKESLLKIKWQEINGWKVAFILLATILIGASLVVMTRLTQERENFSELIEQQPVLTGEPLLAIRSQKAQINKIVAIYLEDLQKEAKKEEQNYQFVLKNEALISGEFDLLGFPLRFYLYLDPFVMDDGNVQLKAKSLSVGALNLPITQVLRMIAKTPELPKWIEVKPKEETIVLRLDQFEIGNGLYLKAEKINLVEDEIEFSLYLAETSTSTKKSEE
ncbi:YpmS family protein [Enterococcus eurekensis]|uniref:YpmS family protein n=1 Tax=Enterococcus eurekensis TaxID=1159753 RepID=A0ABV9M6Z8_9ENTE